MISGKKEAEIFCSLMQIEKQCCDLIEWRADYFESFSNLGAVKELLHKMKGQIGDIPLLVTLRSREEGGESDLDEKAYREWILAVAKMNLADAIDIEAISLWKGDVKVIKNLGAKVVASYHDFLKTPSDEEIEEKLACLKRSGADVIKMAVMSRGSNDTRRLIDWIVKLREKQIPCVLISMGEDGILSRGIGAYAGCEWSYGVGEKEITVAPGQMSVCLSKEIMEELREMERE